MPGFINDLMLDTERLTTDEDSEPVPGYPEWRYKAMAECKAVQLRFGGISMKKIWRVFGESLGRVSMKSLKPLIWTCPKLLRRRSSVAPLAPVAQKDAVLGKVCRSLLKRPNLMRTIEKIQTQYRPISLSGFEKLLKNAGITLPNAVIASLFGQVDDIKIKIGEAEEFVCEDLVSLNELGEAVEKYLSGGMWFLGFSKKLTFFHPTSFPKPND